MTVTVDFNAVTGVLSLALVGNDTADLQVDGSSAIEIRSNNGVTATAAAQAIGFENVAANTFTNSNNTIFPTVTSIVVNGAAGAQIVNFLGGDFDCGLTVNNSIEDANWTTAQNTFNSVDANVTGSIFAGENVVVDTGDLIMTAGNVFQSIGTLRTLGGDVTLSGGSSFDASAISTTPLGFGIDAGDVSITLVNGTAISLGAIAPAIDTRSLNAGAGVSSGNGGDVTIRINDGQSTTATLYLQSPGGIRTNAGNAGLVVGQSGNVTIGSATDNFVIEAYNSINTDGGAGTASGVSGGNGGNVTIRARATNVPAVPGNFPGISARGGAGSVLAAGGNGGTVVIDLTTAKGLLFPLLNGSIDTRGGTGDIGGNGGNVTIDNDGNVTVNVNTNGSGGNGVGSNAGNAGQVIIRATQSSTAIGDVSAAISATGGGNANGNGGNGGNVTIQALAVTASSTWNTSGGAGNQGGSGGDVQISGSSIAMQSITTSAGNGSGLSGGSGGDITLSTTGAITVTNLTSAGGGSTSASGGDGGNISVVASGLAGFTATSLLANGGSGPVAGGDGGAISVNSSLAVQINSNVSTLGGVSSAGLGGAGGTIGLTGSSVSVVGDINASSQNSAIGNNGGNVTVIAGGMTLRGVAAFGGGGSTGAGGDGGDVTLRGGGGVTATHGVRTSGGNGATSGGNAGNVDARITGVSGSVSLGLSSTHAVVADGGTGSAGNGGDGGVVNVVSGPTGSVSLKPIWASGFDGGNAGDVSVISPGLIQLDSSAGTPFSVLGVAAGGEIRFTNSVAALASGADLYVTASVPVIFPSAFSGGSLIFDEISVTSPDATVTGVVQAASSITFVGGLTLNIDTTFVASGDITIDATLDGTTAGSQLATFNTPGTVLFGDVVGAAVALEGIITDAGGETRFQITGAGPHVTTTNDQVYNDAIVLGAGQSTNTSLASSGGVRFNSTVEVNAGFELTLTGGATVNDIMTVGGDVRFLTSNDSLIAGTLRLLDGDVFLGADGRMFVDGVIEGSGTITALGNDERVVMQSGSTLSPGLGGAGAAGTIGTITFDDGINPILELQAGSTLAIQVRDGSQQIDRIQLNDAPVILGGNLNVYIDQTPGVFPALGASLPFITGAVNRLADFNVNGLGALPSYTFVAPNGVDEGAINLRVDYAATSVSLTFPDPSAPTPPTTSTSYFAIAADKINSGPHVVVYDANRNVVGSFFAFAPSFRGGVRVATGDVNLDGVDDVIVAGGPGAKSQIVIIDGAKVGNINPNGRIRSSAIIGSFTAFGNSFTGGVYVAAADVNLDGRADIVVGTGEGTKGRVRVFDGGSFARLRSIVPFGNGYRGGVTVAAGDLNGDGIAEIIAGRATGKSQVRVFDGASAARLASFNAFGSSFNGGVFVATGDVDGDGDADLVTGKGAGSTPEVGVFDGRSYARIGRYNAFAAGFKGGVRVATANVDGDGADEIISAVGKGNPPYVRIHNLDASLVDELLSVDGRFDGGLFAG